MDTGVGDRTRTTKIRNSFADVAVLVRKPGTT